MVNRKLERILERRERGIQDFYLGADYRGYFDTPSDEYVEENIEYIEHDIEVE